MSTAQDFKNDLSQYASDSDAIFLQRYFKTAKGEYGEGDIFIGVRVPQTRKVCKKYKDLDLSEVQKLFDSPVHEHRLAASFLLSEQYKKMPNLRKKIYDMYIKNVYAGRVNNWDIVDLSAKFIVGPYLDDKAKDPIFALVNSNDVWQKRVAVLATFDYINKGRADISLELAEILLHDSHDLIQKAVGWMLREIGIRVDEGILLDFIDKHAHEMPRTMLRYAIEKLSESTRRYYLAKKA